MANSRPIHPDFQKYLDLKSKAVISLYVDLRNYILELSPDCNELLYHTHALTSVYTLSEKLSDGFCMLPIYTNHMNLGFHKGALLDDPNNLLTGTGKLIRHIPISSPKDYRNPKVKQLIKVAIKFAKEDMDGVCDSKGVTISKIRNS